MKRLFLVWSAQRTLLSGLLIGSLLVPHVGCEAITVPIIVAGASATAAFAIAAHEFSDMERIKLDVELKRIELQGMSNGQHLTTFRYLTEEEVRQCANSGRVIVNGVSTPVTLSR